ncbi:MAG TPA: hypothetical protein PLP42_17200 [Acidobacteriota bacterium]|nr:hypothetical protein [Acidobacteriota bacterium]
MNLILFETSKGRLHPLLQTPQLRHRKREASAGYWSQLRERLHDGYQKVADRLNHEELLIANLRHVSQLEVIHSSSEPSTVAEKRFRQFLRLGYSKHRRWFWVDAVLAFFGSFLMFLPGPNVFFFYPAIRSFGHYQACNGARNALKLSQVTFRPDPLVDQIQNNLKNLNAIESAIRELETRYHFNDLKTALQHLGEK